MTSRARILAIVATDDKAFWIPGQRASVNNAGCDCQVRKLQNERFNRVEHVDRVEHLHVSTRSAWLKARGLSPYGPE